MAPRNKSNKVTPTIAGYIRWLYSQTDRNQAQIAALFGLNQGRVSEVITGKREPNVAAIPYLGPF